MPILDFLTTTVTHIKPMLIGTVVVLALAASGYAYHEIVVLKKDHAIAQLQTDLERLNGDIRTLKANQAIYESAATENQSTIDRLQTKLAEQATQAQNLTVTVQRLNHEKQQYLSIFREHDLTKLSRAKPGLVESRINTGTKDVFRNIEGDTK